MFSKKSQPKNNQSVSSQTLNIISEDSIIEGKIKSQSSIRVDGTVKGNVEVEGKVFLSLQQNIW